MAGSIVKRGENTYRLQVYMGSDSYGKEIRFTKTVHVSSKKEADLELAKFYLECERKKTMKNPKCNLDAFIDIWWEDYVKLYTKRSTWNGYKTAVKVHIRPKLGNVPLKNLTAIKIQQWVNDMVRDGLSAKTIKNYYSVLYGILRYAVKWDYIYTNPCEKVDLPKRKKAEMRYYTHEDVNKLLEALKCVPDDFIDCKVYNIPCALCRA